MFKKLCAALAMGLGLTGAWAQDINFGIISTESSQNLKQSWQPLLDDMARKTGLKVNAFFAPDYAGVIEAMRFKKVHVGWFGNKSAMEAVDRANGEIFAKVANADGSDGYYSHLIVHKDSPLKSVDDVLKNGKSLSFGNGDPNSTSGFLVPGYYVFAQNNVDAKTHFRVTRAANHETNALAVATYLEAHDKVSWVNYPGLDSSPYKAVADRVFSGRGYGHGVGLCQVGAFRLAQKGATYKDILKKYYQGIEIEKRS